MKNLQMNKNIFLNSVKHLSLIVCLVLLPLHFANAAWDDFLKDIFSGDSGADNSGSVISGLSNTDVINGLKEALSVSTKKAISTLGTSDGFFANPKVKIPMPENLQTVESALRKLKQDKIADEFVLTMNRAAEQAVPETAAIFSEAIKQMSFDDAKDILNGPDNSATEYFRKTSGAKLVEKILPIVKTATAKTGVTSNYKSLFDNLGFMKNLIDVESMDIDRYITNKTVDGLFWKLAAEEKLIRTDPLARTTDILKKIFTK